jgi:acyl dehydratase
MTGTVSDPLAPGTRLVGTSRTITDAEISFLPALMGAISPLFHDDVRATASGMGGRILYGPALLGISIALTEHLLRDRVMGLVEVRSLRFRRPVRAGDTITAHLHVRESTPRAGRDGTLLVVEDEIVNQDDVVVCRFERVILVRTTEGTAAP